MRVAILTTDTPHHRYFVNRLTAHCDIVGVLLEKFEPEPPLPAQEEIEREVFGSLGEQWMTGLIVRQFGNLNNHDPIEWLGLLDADLGIVFGTGKLKPDVFNVPRLGCINVHRGLTTSYRGLDCDLWPIYDGQFQRVGVTIHKVDADFDTGEICTMEAVHLYPGLTLGALRAATTIRAAQMVGRILDELPLSEELVSFAPEKKGKYCTRMPEFVREATARRLQAHLRGEADDD